MCYTHTPKCTKHNDWTTTKIWLKTEYVWKNMRIIRMEIIGKTKCSKAYKEKFYSFPLNGTRNKITLTMIWWNNDNELIRLMWIRMFLLLFSVVFDVLLSAASASRRSQIRITCVFVFVWGLNRKIKLEQKSTEASGTGYTGYNFSFLLATHIWAWKRNESLIRYNLNTKWTKISVRSSAHHLALRNARTVVQLLGANIGNYHFLVTHTPLAPS